MNRLLITFIFLFPFISIAQQRQQNITYLTKDSLKHDYDLTRNWRFHFGDDIRRSEPGYIDSDWRITSPYLEVQGKGKNQFLDTFNSICWLRLHFIVDSSLTGIPLCFRLKQSGASELYLDGKLIQSYGEINGKDSSDYFNPQRLPLTFTLFTAGEHVLAVRYANYNAQQNSNVYDDNAAGFSMTISLANKGIEDEHATDIGNALMFLVLSSIFITLTFVHLFLFLYYRAQISNLYFSIFCFSIGLLILIPYISAIATGVHFEHWSSYVVWVAAVTSCVSLSGLINNLFSRNKLRFKIFLLAGIVMCVIGLFSETGYFMFALTVYASIEAIILTIIGIYRNVKGAKIIGFGILFFTLLVLFITGLAVFEKSIHFSNSSTGGLIAILILAAAILSVPASMSIYLAWNFANINKELQSQLQQVEVLSAKTIEQEQEKKRLLETQNEQLEKEVAQRTAEIEKQHQELKAEKKKSDDLLNNILPEEIAEELKQKGISSARFFDHVTVLFTDFVAFTKAGERMSPQELVGELHTCFKSFDDIISKYNIEKIKTIGDAYLAVCGLPVADNNNAINVAKAALEIKQFMLDRKQKLGDKTFEIRIGIHSGSVVAGIVGVKKFAYDIWGDTVNTAARMEQNSEPGKINCSQTTYELIKDQFTCTYRGEITAKNKGELSMYFIEAANLPGTI